MKPVRYTYDTEFVDDGHSIELISIGIVCIDDGREYYAVNRNLNTKRVREHPWLSENVLPHLPTRYNDQHDLITIDYEDPIVKYKPVIAAEVHEFLCMEDGRDPADRSQRELWAYFASYDHVALAQLWGPMSALPGGIPMFTRDIKDWAIRLGDPELPKQTGQAHNALDDARHNVVVMHWLKEHGYRLIMRAK